MFSCFYVCLFFLSLFSIFCRLPLAKIQLWRFVNWCRAACQLDVDNSVGGAASTAAAAGQPQLGRQVGAARITNGRCRPHSPAAPKMPRPRTFPAPRP